MSTSRAGGLLPTAGTQRLIASCRAALLMSTVSLVPARGADVAPAADAAADATTVALQRRSESAAIQLVAAEEPVEGVLPSSGEAQWIW